MTKNRTSAILAGAVVAGLLGLLVAYVGVAQASTDADILGADEYHPQETPSQVISVTGHAETTVDPELLVVKLGISATQFTAADALAENKRMTDEVINAILTTGVSEDEIHTSFIHIVPRYNNEIISEFADPSTGFGSDMPILAGYLVSNVVTVTTQNLTVAADLLDRAVEAGANTVESVDFTLLPETEKLIHERLLAEATSDAKNRAEIVLAQLDQEIVGVESIQTDIYDELDALVDVLDPLTSLLDLFGSAGGEPTPTPTSDQTLEKSVVVTFLIGPK